MYSISQMTRIEETVKISKMAVETEAVELTKKAGFIILNDSPVETIWKASIGSLYCSF